MKMKQISDSTIKITIQLEDKLDVFVTKSKIDHHLNFEDFSDLPDMEELSQMSPDEFIKTLEKTISEKSKGDGDAIRHLEAEELADENQLSEEDTPNHPVDTRYIYYILQFSQLEEVIRFTKTVHYAVETSELYKMDGIYYLTVLIDLEGCPQDYPGWLLATMREYAEDTDTTRAVLQEHGHLLLVSDAIHELQKVNLV